MVNRDLVRKGMAFGVLIGLLGAASIPGPVAWAQTIKIGFIGEMSGPLARFGDDGLKGAELFVEQVNQKGGVLGRRLEVVARDDKTREAVILAILIARGMSREIEYHVHAALNVGMTRKDIEEIIMVCAYYAGGPHAVAAIHASLNVFKERGI